MGVIQEYKRIRNKKEYCTYSLNLDKSLIDRLHLQKGDRLDFNGEMVDEVRFKIVRKPKDVR